MAKSQQLLQNNTKESYFLLTPKHQLGCFYSTIKQLQENFAREYINDSRCKFTIRCDNKDVTKELTNDEERHVTKTEKQNYESNQ